jgi:hypothetical protein
MKRSLRRRYKSALRGGCRECRAPEIRVKGHGSKVAVLEAVAWAGRAVVEVAASFGWRGGRFRR